MSTIITAELPKTAAITTTHTNIRKNPFPITSSQGLNASGIG